MKTPSILIAFAFLAAPAVAQEKTAPLAPAFGVRDVLPPYHYRVEEPVKPPVVRRYEVEVERAYDRRYDRTRPVRSVRPVSRYWVEVRERP